jgi:hypothetical protein
MKTKKDIRYVQCALQHGIRHHMAWIPEKFAILGKFIKIKLEDGVFEDGWKVAGVSEGSRSSTEANEGSQLYKKTRKASDI